MRPAGGALRRIGGGRMKMTVFLVFLLFFMLFDDDRVSENLLETFSCLFFLLMMKDIFLKFFLFDMFLLA